ncbi:hypothetical protein Ahy_A07g037102 [Arachis hypogaea]|uniref:Zinc knuckle CX2CX4HX4C domain-containing protein n=1 Tax=Arachis hypogaea TaxID=3818 RepID=A0A445CHV2_ARAHY|nr:hypothetical protein Ahy_A07g037102 [Arachis hypogaea]
MQRIASAVDKPIKVDVATKEAERGKFARACILIDLGVPMIDEIEGDDVIYKVDYEHLELICEKCRCYGHVAVDCNKVNDVKAVEEDFSLPKNDNQHGYPKSAPGKVHEELGDDYATNQEEAIGAWIKVVQKKGKVLRNVDNNPKSQGPKNNRPNTKKHVVVANLSKRPMKYGHSFSSKSNNQLKSNNTKNLSPSHEGTVAGTSGSKLDTPFLHYNRKRLRPRFLQNSP